MNEGFYRVEFATPFGFGAGVVDLREGRVRGGDSMMYYVGTYSIDGNRLEATVHVDRHTQKTAGFGDSVFGVDKLTATFSGTIDGNTIVAIGTSPAAPGISLRAGFHRIAD